MLLALMFFAAPPTMADDADAQILDAFLRNVEDTAGYATPERMAAFAAQPEDITWQASKYVRMPLVAYWLTGDATYLDAFVRRMTALMDRLTEGPDGYLGWYGLPLEIFRHPDFPNRQTDVMLTSFVVAGLIAEFAQTAQANDALNERYGGQAQEWLAVAENHLVAKWDARGRYKDLGEAGAVYIANAELGPLKAGLTQPHNKHSKIGRALLLLFQATGNDAYLMKAVKLGTRFKRCLTLEGDRYTWNYWDPSGDWDVHPDNPNRWKHWIGAEHRGGYYSLSASQAVRLYEHRLVFDREDMERFTRTQVEVCWNGDFENPEWRRVDGGEADGAYLCSSLSPFNDDVYEMAFGEPAQASRLSRVDHDWHGGVVAADWLESKYLVYARWKTGEPAEPIASNAGIDALAFDVTAAGYEAPRRPRDLGVGR